MAYDNNEMILYNDMDTIVVFVPEGWVCVQTVVVFVSKEGGYSNRSRVRI